MSRGFAPAGIRQMRSALPQRQIVVCFLSALCLLGAAAEPALAAAPPAQQTAPADGATVRRDAPLTFSANDPSDLGNVYVNVAASPSVDTNGALNGTVLDSFDLYGAAPAYSFTRTYQSESHFLSNPGTYYWQVTRIDCDYPDCLALSGVRSLKVVPATEHSGQIPASAGHQTDGGHLHSFRLFTGSLPAGVDLDRLQTIAARSAARWGIGFGGRTAAKPHVPAHLPDGVSSVGFSPEIQPGVLGLTWIYKQNVYRPGKLGCHRRHGHRACHRGPRRYAGTRVVDEDIEIDPYRIWQAGPRYPNFEQFDLESVLIHELGHFAGNGHVFACEDSPMIATIAPGDWWHAENDWNRYGCSGTTPAARLARARAPNLRVITRYVPAGWRPPSH